MALRDTVKLFFLTGLKPTQSQFHTMLNSVVFIDELAGLTLNFKYTATANFSRIIPAEGAVEKIAIVPVADITLSIGTAPGGTNIMDNVFIPAGNTDMQIIEKYFDTGATLYFTGVTSSTKFKFYQRT